MDGSRPTPDDVAAAAAPARLLQMHFACFSSAQLATPLG